MLKRTNKIRLENIVIEEIRGKRLGKAFAPGHTTGFFEIRDRHRELLKKGSRGSGICLSKGAITKVAIEPSDKQIVSIFINGEKSQAPVSSYVVKKMIGNAKLNLRIETILELPTGQGFGMSSAGALSTAFALAQALRVKWTFWDIVGIAHCAEVVNKTGLGDVVAASTGGITIRKKEGVPPLGFVDNIFDSVKERDIELCVISGKIQTKSVLTDSKKRQDIINAGRKALRSLLKSPTLENMFVQSRKFALESRLIDERVREAVEEACIEGLATMSMLGNSLFATGVEPKRLQRYGQVIECKVDEKGPRILE